MSMGMSMTDNEEVVARIIANHLNEVSPLAIRLKDFNVRGITQNEAEVSLERLKLKGAVKGYRHRWGFFGKKSGQKLLTFEETGTEPQFQDDAGQAGEEAEVYVIDATRINLDKYLKSRPTATPAQRMIEKKGNDFYLEGQKLKFTTDDSIYFKLLDILYGEDGEGKLLSYELLDRALVRLDEEQLDDHEKVLMRIRNAVHGGLYNRVNKDLAQYVKIRPRKGVELLNPRRS